jgi:hypothetical protein
MRLRKIVMTIFTWVLIFNNAPAVDGKFSGYMFGDLYWIAANHNSGLENQNGLWFRRIYFTYDESLSDAFAIRFRLEANSPGDFSTKSKLNPFVKDAYVKWSRGLHSFYLGLSTPPTFQFIENVWGYRFVEKTPVDLQKFGASREIGLSLKGNLDPANRVQYHFMIGNGNGTSSETDKGKKVMLALTIEVAKNLFVQGYGDWNDLPGEADRYTAQGAILYKSSSFRAGAQLLRQTRQQAGDLENQELEIGSVFAAAKLGKKTWCFARVDRGFDPNPDGEKISYLPFSSSAKSTLILAGLDFELDENVNLIPNIELVIYDVDSGDAPDSDVIPRLTFYYRWK